MGPGLLGSFRSWQTPQSPPSKGACDHFTFSPGGSGATLMPRRSAVLRTSVFTAATEGVGTADSKAVKTRRPARFESRMFMSFPLRGEPPARAIPSQEARVAESKVEWGGIDLDPDQVLRTITYPTPMVRTNATLRRA